MKAFHVKGWKQYKTDCATPIDRVQIALSMEDAMKDVIHSQSGEGWKFVLDVKEFAFDAMWKL